MAEKKSVIKKENAEARENLSWFGWLPWNKYSESMVSDLEIKILEVVKSPHQSRYVDLAPLGNESENKIWTLSLNENSPKTPLVLLHGLGAGVALWCLNLDALAAHRPVYAIDILGFGRSSRPNFTKSKEAEHELVNSIEEWRKKMNLEEVILLGHSFGGFLAAAYTISHPERVKHLILIDPWGFPEKHELDKDEFPFLIRTLICMMQPFNPLAGLRVAGPFGPKLVNTIRPDLSKKYELYLHEPNLIPEYIYKCNSRHPSGEIAFQNINSGFAWAKNPILRRIDQLHENVPITLLYGSDSWVDHLTGNIITEKRPNSYVNIQIIPGAGHHVFADKPDDFNQAVVAACDQTDNNKLGK